MGVGVGGVMVFAVTGANIMCAEEAAGHSALILTAGLMLRRPDSHRFHPITRDQNRLVFNRPSELTTISMAQEHVLTRSTSSDPN